MRGVDGRSAIGRRGPGISPTRETDLRQLNVGQTTQSELMNIRTVILAVITAVSCQSIRAQVIPVPPESSGLQPRSTTVYINNLDTLNNFSTEAVGVAIADNGNVLVGWEDDGDGLDDLGAVWTLLDPAGQSITPITRITSSQAAYAGQVRSNRFLSYFRADGSATPGFTSWGPKIKANLFGSGLGMGATSYDLGLEVTEFQAFDAGGDYPTVQLLAGNGAPGKTVAGLTQIYTQTQGDIRIADWDYLANGNVVIVAESQQQADLVDLYGGTTAANHIVYRIVDPTGNEVSEVALASEQPVQTAMWHGVGVTENGFAIRFEKAGKATVRMFNNAGAPITGDIDLQTLTGVAVASGGGPGESAGFHGNGKDAYVAVNSGQHEGQRVVWVTVLNDDGTLRWSKSAVTDLTLTAQLGAADAAIEKNGEVIVVFSDVAAGNPVPFVMGCRLDSRRRAHRQHVLRQRAGGSASLPGARLAGCLRPGLRCAMAWWRSRGKAITIPTRLASITPRWPCACSPRTNPAPSSPWVSPAWSPTRPSSCRLRILGTTGNPTPACWAQAPS